MASRKRTRLQSLSETSESRRAQEQVALEEVPEPHHDHTGLRAWMEALVLAFVLAMFVRVFIFELYKVPTGSMTPTIIGGTIIETDLNRDGEKDLGVFLRDEMQAFLRDGNKLVYDQQKQRIDPETYKSWADSGMIRNEYHRIFVNKFRYWFRGPERGEIIVFKVPEPAFDPTKPLFIKRAVGVPGDEISFNKDGHLQIANDPNFTQFEFFKEHFYRNTVNPLEATFQRFDYIEYGENELRQVELKKIHLPDDMFYAMGDNTDSSLDSRYWGAVKLDRLKGKAFFRYWPLRKISFLR